MPNTVSVFTREDALTAAIAFYREHTPEPTPRDQAILGVLDHMVEQLAKTRTKRGTQESSARKANRVLLEQILKAWPNGQMAYTLRDLVTACGTKVKWPCNNQGGLNSQKATQALLLGVELGHLVVSKVGRTNVYTLAPTKTEQEEGQD